jgi:16S rRNA (guanine527-N7)-methyltransferase
MSDSSEFRAILDAEAAETLSSEQRERVVRFREEVLRENEVQNLTRILSPRDFYEGHVVDVLELRKFGIAFPALDLGAGVGVPGLLSAVIYGEEGWISCDSEQKKAEFVSRMADFFELKGFRAVSGRAEDFLAKDRVETVVSRAVGPVSRIYGWIGACSTWNSLVLLKGPRWEEEWAEFQKTSQRKRLKIHSEQRYTVGPEAKRRVIVRLDR